MEKDFVYYAFISYNHEDEKWAKWLQRKLESYKLPAVICKENPRLPKRIYPIFRDKTDMGACFITDGLQKELEDSQYLIVICSPRAVKSEWVGKEITMFTQMGRADRIIPFIVDGTPNSGDSRECFHQAIKENVPDVLGININEIGREQAFIKVTAKLLGLRFDILWDRFRREQRKKRFIAASVSLLFLAVIGIGLFFWGPKREYYADYVDKFGIPKGIIELDKSQVKRRSAHYRFEYLLGKLRRVVYANSAASPLDHHNTEYIDRPSIQELEYRGKRLTTSILKNSKGKTIAVYEWGGRDHDRIDIMSNIERDSGASIAASFTSISFNAFMDSGGSKAAIRRYKLTRNDDGYIICKEFMQNNGNDSVRACDSSGIWGFEYFLDDLGRPVEIRYLGSNGEGDYRPDKIGVMSRKYKYDDFGNIKTAAYFGEGGKPVSNEQFWSIGIDITDENGNIKHEAYYDTDGNPCLNISGCAGVESEFDRGNMTKIVYLDTDGNPCYIKDGYAGLIFEYDKHGNMTKIIFLDTDGNPCYGKNGFAGWRAEYKKRGNIFGIAYFDMTETVSLDMDGNPCYNKDGYSGWRAEYDRHGNRIYQYCFDTEGRYCLHKDGFGSWSAIYDSLGNMEEALFLGGSSDFRITYKYENGNMIETSFIDMQGNPFSGKFGFSKWTANYNDQGNITEESYFGKDGNLFLIEAGYAMITRKYDDRGYVMEESYFDAEGNPCLTNAGGSVKIIYNYDEWGNIKDIFCVDINNNPYLVEAGYARINRECDDRRNITAETYYDLNGSLCIFNIGGFAKLTRKYNARGNIIEESYFDIGGNPCFQKDGGFAKLTRKYDPRENMIEESYFDADGNPCLNIIGGIAKGRAKYDERDNVTEVTCFDADGNPCLNGDYYAKQTIKYDARGNITEFSFFGTDGRPCLNKYGFSKWTIQYDELGNFIGQAYFDTDGNPITQSY